MSQFSNFIHRLYDALEHGWNGHRGHRLAGTLLVLCFLVSMGLVELKRFIVYPESFAGFVPKNHLAAIETSLTLLLIIEVMGLIFSLVRSMTTSVGHQLEILSLILLRNVFKQISHLSEPLVWTDFASDWGHLASTSVAALLIFLILSFFYKVRKQEALSGIEKDKNNFILAKKIVAMGLLISFHVILIHYFWIHFLHGDARDPFESFYTLLIISDILILLISMRYGNDYPIAFRNSGFAVVTVFIRISLISPPYYSSAIGVGAALFALGTLYTYSLFMHHQTESSMP